MERITIACKKGKETTRRGTLELEQQWKENLEAFLELKT
jgi:hypothetical protein